jgi:hypothetical protein
MVLARARLAMTRSGSAENRLDAMACNTFGWTPVVSTNRTAPSSQRLSTLCFAGTVNAAKCYVYLSDVSRPAVDVTTSQPAALGIGISEKQMVHSRLDPSRAYCSGIS